MAHFADKLRLITLVTTTLVVANALVVHGDEFQQVHSYVPASPESIPEDAKINKNVTEIEGIPNLPPQ